MRKIADKQKKQKVSSWKLCKEAHTRNNRLLRHERERPKGDHNYVVTNAPTVKRPTIEKTSAPTAVGCLKGQRSSINLLKKNAVHLSSL